MASYGLPQLRLQSLMTGGYDPFQQNQSQQGASYDPGFYRDVPNAPDDPGFYRDVPNAPDDPGFYRNLPQSPLEKIGQNPSTFGASGPSPAESRMGAPRPVTPPGVSTYGGGNSAERVMEMINKIYTPENTDRDRLRALMDAAPERESPGWGRGLAAIGVGLGSKDITQGLANQESVMFAPHRRAMADWTAKADPFLKTAELENRGNINERTLAGNVATTMTNADRYEAQAQTAAERNRINEIKALAEKYKAEKWSIVKDGPDVWAYPPDGSTGQRRHLGSSSGMSEHDEIVLRGNYQIAASEASGKAAMDRLQASGTGVYQSQDGRKWRIDPNNPNTMIPITGGPEDPVNKIGTPGTAKSPDTDSPAETRTRRQNEIDSIIGEDPTKNREFFVGSPGRYELGRRPKQPRFWGDNTEKIERYDKIAKRLNPNYQPPADESAPPPPKEAVPQSRGATPDINFSNLPPPEIKIKPESMKGLGPQNVPVASAPETPAPAGRITIYKNGKPAGTISDNPEAIRQAIQNKFEVRM